MVRSHVDGGSTRISHEDSARLTRRTVQTSYSALPRPISPSRLTYLLRGVGELNVRIRLGATVLGSRRTLFPFVEIGSMVCGGKRTSVAGRPAGRKARGG